MFSSYDPPPSLPFFHFPASSFTHCFLTTSCPQVTVLEAMVRNVAIMMRRDDQWVNASQILKVSGVGKAERSRLIETELTGGPHENVTSKGYGKYQGVWVPLSTGMDLANKYGVGALLAPVFSLQQSAALSMPPPPVPFNPTAGPGSPLQSQGPVSKRPASFSGPSAGQQQGGMSNAQNGGLTSPFTSAALTSAALPVPSQRYAQQQRQGSSQQQQQQHPVASPFPGQQMYMTTSQGDMNLYNQTQTSSQAGFYTPSPYGSMAPPSSNQVSKRPLEEDPNAHHQQQLLQLHTPRKQSLDIAHDEPPAKKMRMVGPDVNVNDNDNDAAFFDELLGLDDSNVFDDMADYARASPPPGTRFATKPSRPVVVNGSGGASEASPSAQRNSLKSRNKLLAILEAQEDAEVDLGAFMALGTPKSSPIRPSGVEELDVDQVIDDKGHTALHWATSLARDKLVDQLIAQGADIHRGNFAGETPLIRAALTNNNAERNSFSELLERHLGPSLRTVDRSHKTVLHHIANVANVKGRVGSANAYMSAVIEYLARHDPQPEMREFVNIQDLAGDTALNIAARVGNTTHIKLLLEAGADKTKANNMGLRPSDFGVALEVSRCVLFPYYCALPEVE